MAGLRRMVGSVLDVVDGDDRVRKLRNHLAAIWAPKTWYLRGRRGIIHVGANIGQERNLYRSCNLDVLWIEPIPEVFQNLANNLKAYPRQKALQALVTDKDGEEHTLHIANNNGASSSILDFQDHGDIWPDIQFCGEVKLVSSTLDTLMARSRTVYDVLLLDIQGAELLALKGAVRTLRSMRYVMVEAADFEAYVGCAKVDEIEAFMTSQGFEKVRADLQATRPGGGSYFDLLFKRSHRATASAAVSA